MRDSARGFWASLVASALGWTAMVGCASTSTVTYRTNSQVIVDELTKAAPTFVADAPIPEDARVALMNLDGRHPESANPSEAVYDHLAIALSKRGVFIVERDAEGLQASVLESWSTQLPFLVSAPCMGQCTKVEESEARARARSNRDSNGAAASAPSSGGRGSGRSSSRAPKAAPATSKAEPGFSLVIQTCSQSQCSTDNKDGCRSCTEPMIATSAEDLVKIAKLLEIMRPAKATGDDSFVTITTAGVDPQPVAELPVEKRSYADIFGRVQLPSWFKKDGSKIVAEQASATHIMAFRVLTLGNTVEPGEAPEVVRRRTRIDLILRLIRTRDGVVVWSDRVNSEEVETFPRSMEPLLTRSPFRFAPSQFAPSSNEPLLPLFGR